jgi:hypothetical protein
MVRIWALAMMIYPEPFEQGRGKKGTETEPFSKARLSQPALCCTTRMLRRSIVGIVSVRSNAGFVH